MTATSNDPGTLSLRVSDKREIASEVFMFELGNDDGAELPAFTAGAHITIALPNGETRKYSLTNDPAERSRYVIAVKREATGRGGSTSLCDGVKAGDSVQVRHPRNDFALKGNPISYIFIAGGIGITPIRSMIRHLEGTGGKPFKLYYFTRTPEQMAFREELSAPVYRGRVVLHHDGGDPDKAFDLWPVLETPRGAHVYCCGPRPLMQAVRDMTGHWSAAAVRFEDFGAAKADAKDNIAFRVRLAKSGTVIDVPADKSILEILRAQGHEIASSCESGTCGTCRTALLAGEADHRDLVLADHEKARNIMICVSRAPGGELTLDL